jgi:hypothetical protein
MSRIPRSSGTQASFPPIRKKSSDMAEVDSSSEAQASECLAIEHSGVLEFRTRSDSTGRAGMKWVSTSARPSVSASLVVSHCRE